jgi:S1-C subfamily serine protease
MPFGLAALALGGAAVLAAQSGFMRAPQHVAPAPASGFTEAPLDRGAAREMGLPAGVNGAVVTSLADGGPAARAGIEIGDVVVRDGHRAPGTIEVVHRGVARTVALR